MNRPLQDDAERWVRMAYEMILLRPPEHDGALAKVADLLAGRTDPEALLRAFFECAEFADKQAEFLRRYVSPDRRRLFLDHSQNGEFLHIVKFLMERAHTNKLIVDVGARGSERSNSYDLLRHFGWRGLLIEANPSLQESIRADFAGTNFVLENAAVSDHEGRADFFLGVNEDISSLNQAATARWGPVHGKTSVEVHKLATLLERHGIPPVFDILSMDIEGEDVRTLNALIAESAYRPRLIIIEVGEMPDPRNIRALGFSAEVCWCYEYFAHCGPNLFLTAVG